MSNQKWNKVEVFELYIAHCLDLAPAPPAVPAAAAADRQVKQYMQVG